MDFTPVKDFASLPNYVFDIYYFSVIYILSKYLSIFELTFVFMTLFILFKVLVVVTRLVSVFISLF